MLLTSNSFLFLFLPFSLLISLFSVNKKIKTLYLGILSAYFYYIDNGYLLIILLFLATLLKLQIDKNIFNTPLFIVLLLTPLIIFKYSFIFFNFISFDTPTYIIQNFPIGLSFFTFQSIAYYFDKRRVENCESGFEIFTFLTFFPQLLAGPIVDISTFRNGLNARVVNIESLQTGLYRISLGLIKKFLIADTLSQITSIYINSNYDFTFSFTSSVILVLSYTFQIYFDFSAYCDIAIGIGMLFGFNLPENFNRPYLSNSFREFWRRWHMTLSNFFKVYVYIPLGGNRVSKYKNFRNLWITFFLTALWHGATINFLLWGFLHGLFLTIEKLLNYKKLFSNRFLTFILISVSWIPFFSKSSQDTIDIISSIFTFQLVNDDFLPIAVQYFNLKFLIVTLICIASLFNIKVSKKLFKNRFVTMTMFIFSLVLVIVSSVDPFIYFRF
tara:strand:+ start:2021 stop:3346 length:1326 start_codon:yes stop_codon:yes gene_type:complete